MNSYQPPNNFPATSSKDSQPTPIQYGQNRVDHEIVTQKLEIKRELQIQEEALLKGKVGWAIMIWFGLMIFSSSRFSISSYNTFKRDYQLYKQLMGIEGYNRLMIIFMILGAWLIVQSLLVIYALRKMSVLGAKLLRATMIIFILGSSLIAYSYIVHNKKFSESEMRPVGDLCFSCWR